MSFQSIIWEQTGHVLQITLNQPEKRNPLNKEVCTELIQALRQAEADDQVRAVIITGAGDSFCAGGDLRDFQKMSSTPSLNVFDNGMLSTEVFYIGASYTKPLIAAVNGAAFGGGTGLAAMCHFAIAADTARFGCTEIRLGLFPLVILPALRKRVGDTVAVQMSLSGDIFSAEESRALGLVWKVVPREKLAEESLALGTKLASYSPVAMRLGLTGFNETSGMEVEQGAKYLNTLRVVAFQTEDLNEGATAFLEKRSPQWRGR